MADVQLVKLGDIKRDQSMQVRKALSKDAVKRYIDAFDDLPPIVLFRVKAEGSVSLYLTDGWHRDAAAQARAGKDWKDKTIGAEIREGTYDEAKDYALAANMTHGMPLTIDERDEAIRWLAANHDGKEGRAKWTVRQIADHMGITSHMTVQRVINMDKAKARIKSVLGELPDKLSDSHFRELATLPETKGGDEQAKLAKAAAEYGWSVAQLVETVQELKDKTPAESESKQKEKDARRLEILAGKINPHAKAPRASVASANFPQAHTDVNTLYETLKGLYVNNGGAKDAAAAAKTVVGNCGLVLLQTMVVGQPQAGIPTFDALLNFLDELDFAIVERFKEEERIAAEAAANAPARTAPKTRKGKAKSNGSEAPEVGPSEAPEGAAAE